VLDLRVLVGKPRALVRRALRRWLHAAQLARKGFEELLAIWERGAGRMGAGEGVIEIADGVLRFVRTGAPPEPATRWSATSVPMSAGVSLFLPDGACLRAECIELTAALRGKIFAGAVDPTREVFIAVNNGAPLFHAQVRPWRPGDRYRPLGAPGAAKLQDLFVNRKIPPVRRRALPVVCGEAGEIMWVPGFPPAETGRLAEHSSQAVHLTYEIGTCTVGFQSITKNSS
jgi:tRNA(Ile)-lysidine synthase